MPELDWRNQAFSPVRAVCSPKIAGFSPRFQPLQFALNCAGRYSASLSAAIGTTEVVPFPVSSVTLAEKPAADTAALSVAYGMPEGVP